MATRLCNGVDLIMTTKRKKKEDKPMYLLEGKPYVPAAKTNILNTLRKLGWVPPSEAKQNG